MDIINFFDSFSSFVSHVFLLLFLGWILIVYAKEIIKLFKKKTDCSSRSAINNKATDQIHTTVVNQRSENRAFQNDVVFTKANKSEYQWKFEYACLLIAFLIVSLLFSWSKVSNLESRIADLESDLIEHEAEYYNEGHEIGYNKGYDIGYTDGLSDGEPNGYSDGYDDGYLYGYAFGITDAMKGAVEEMDSFTLEFLQGLAIPEKRGKPID